MEIRQRRISDLLRGIRQRCFYSITIHFNYLYQSGNVVFGIQIAFHSNQATLHVLINSQLNTIINFNLATSYLESRLPFIQTRQRCMY